MDRLMSNVDGYWENRGAVEQQVVITYNFNCSLDCLRLGNCGHFPDSFTSPGLSATEWTNVNSFETIYNAMWQTATV